MEIQISEVRIKIMKLSDKMKQKTQILSKEEERIAERFKAFFKKPGAKEKISLCLSKALEKAEETSEFIRNAQKIDERILHEPMTI